MRRVIEATTDKEKEDKKDKSLKALTGLAALSIIDHSAKKRTRQKLMNDIMYYLRKLLNLAKQVQNLTEGVDDEEILAKQSEDFDEIKKKIDELEAELKED